MYSIAFPNILSSTTTNLVKDKEATSSNLQLLLLSERNSLLGDPYFGTELKALLFEQNDNVLKDIVIDEIYTSIQTFMPQLVVKRSDIEITAQQEKAYITIKGLNLLDFTTNLYNINLTINEEG